MQGDNISFAQQKTGWHNKSSFLPALEVLCTMRQFCNSLCIFKHFGPCTKRKVMQSCCYSGWKWTRSLKGYQKNSLSHFVHRFNCLNSLHESSVLIIEKSDNKDKQRKSTLISNVSKDLIHMNFSGGLRVSKKNIF